MGRPSNKEQRREQIVDALLAVMSKSGYEKASIQNIAREAGLTAGLVHYHFKNKQEVLIELVKSIHQVASQRYKSLSAQAQSPSEHLDSFIDAALALGPGSDDDAVAAWVVIGSEAIRQEDVKSAYQEAVKSSVNELQRLLTNVAEHNKLAVKDADLYSLASSLYGAIEGAYLLVSSTNDIAPTDYAAKTVKRMAIATLEHYAKNVK